MSLSDPYEQVPSVNIELINRARVDTGTTLTRVPNIKALQNEVSTQMQKKRDDILDAMVTAFGLNTPYIGNAAHTRAALYTIWQEMWFAISACCGWYTHPSKLFNLITIPQAPGIIVYFFCTKTQNEQEHNDTSYFACVKQWPDFWACVPGNVLIILAQILFAVFYLIVYCVTFAIRCGKPTRLSSMQLQINTHSMDDRNLQQLVPMQLVRQNCFKITIVGLLAVYFPRKVWPVVQNIEHTIYDVQTAVDNIVTQITPGEIAGINQTLQNVENIIGNISATVPTIVSDVKNVSNAVNDALPIIESDVHAINATISTTLPVIQTDVIILNATVAQLVASVSQINATLLAILSAINSTLPP